jgi:hypothetical protein
MVGDRFLRNIHTNRLTQQIQGEREMEIEADLQGIVQDRKLFKKCKPK